MVEDKLEIEEMSMSELLAESTQKVSNGALIEARVLGKNADGVLVDIGLKMEGLIPKAEFPDFEKGLPFKEGEKIPVIVRQIEGHDHHHKISWRAARELSSWDRLVAAQQAGTPLDGRIVKKIKGGYLVDIGVDAFLPGSQLDLRPTRDVEAWVNQTVQVVITEMERSKSNVVVSRRKWLEQERHKHREVTLGTLSEGQTVKGTITSLTSFGAFLDIGGIEGLLHISDMSWKRVEKPDQVVKLGQILEAKILKFDRTTQRISLGLKQLQPHPWEGIQARYPIGTLVKGKVTSLTNFGAFVELEPGVEGLIHVSELSWKERVAKPQDVLKAGDEVSVKVLLVDPAKEKLSLSLKRVGTSPWDLAKANHPQGSKIKGKITHLAPFGAFLLLPEGVEGLIHVSDMSWTRRIQHPSEKVTVGQELEVVVLDVRPEAEKISLSLRHMERDPLLALKSGDTVTARITRVGENGVQAELADGFEAYVRPQEFSEDLEGKPEGMAVGQEITGKIIRVDVRERKAELSIRRYDRDEERRMLKQYVGQQKPMTLGDMLKAQEADKAEKSEE
jgi:small subunit ribosomal protein S1